MDLIDVLKRNDVNKSEFLKSTLECMHGGVHGINVCDIIDSISENSEFLNELQKDLTEESINNLLKTKIVRLNRILMEIVKSLKQNVNSHHVKLVLEHHKKLEVFSVILFN